MSSSSSSSSYGELRDFDWSARIAWSSDKISCAKQPLMVVKFDTVDDNGAKQEKVIEMTLDESREFLQRIKEAKKAMED